MDHADTMSAAVDVAVSAIRGADVTHFADPSPCADWTVEQAVNHLAFGLLLADRAGRKQQWDEGWAESERCPYLRDVPQEQWAGKAAEQGRDTAAAWAEPGSWEGEASFGGSAMPASAIGSMMTAEFVLHSWDVAAATGQQLDVPEELAAAALAGVESIAAMGRDGGWFGQEVAVGPDATTLDKALAASGRDPAWTP